MNWIVVSQVIFTKRDGTTVIEQWVKGEKVETGDDDDKDAIAGWADT